MTTEEQRAELRAQIAEASAVLAVLRDAIAASGAKLTKAQRRLLRLELRARAERGAQ